MYNVPYLRRLHGKELVSVKLQIALLKIICALLVIFGLWPGQPLSVLAGSLGFAAALYLGKRINKIEKSKKNPAEEFMSLCDKAERLLRRLYGDPAPRKHGYLRATLQGFEITSLGILVLSSKLSPEELEISMVADGRIAGSGEDAYLGIEEYLLSQSADIEVKAGACRREHEMLEVYGGTVLHAFHYSLLLTSGSQTVELHFFGQESARKLRSWRFRNT